MVWDYSVSLQPSGNSLRVEASFEDDTSRRLSLQTGAENFVLKPEILMDNVWKPLLRRGDFWFLPEEGPYRIRYDFQVKKAVESLDDWRFAASAGRVMIAQPSVWMLRPLSSELGDELEFAVETPIASRFVSGINQTDGVYRIDCRKLAFAPLSAFGPLELRTVKFGEHELQIALDPDQFVHSEEQMFDWVQSASEEVESYLDGFPVPHALILLVSSSRNQGRTQGDGGASIALRVDRDFSLSELREHWLLRHELLHLAHPSLPRHRWFEEGLAVYAELALRVNHGHLSSDDFWKELQDRFPDGQRNRDYGLEETVRHDHIYWGGALYFFLADLRIRQRTQNRLTIHDAIRAWHHSGGNVSVSWSLKKTIEVGDRALGEPILGELFEQIGKKAGKFNLHELWFNLEDSSVKAWIAP